MPTLKSTLANLFLKNGDYRSDATDFITDIKRARPELDAQQRAGRALLWDKNVDRSQLADTSAATVKQQAYVYQTKA
ncbi:DUF3460 family protein [Variovorax sp. PCZ-1]|uniref:DUF3460 family protein n=1 Tax=Variovorax sp. PCZ-1 TaxID=2835533 RepID=UPI001BD06A4B|nr:DUF3460 family protein [Variovorax sp. PCZ-1]MBS7806347.1 DUF3460 family protein [Variovorax sp. PCZ-1]